MCGRYALLTTGDALAAVFDLVEVPEASPRANVAPMQDAPVIRAGAADRGGGGDGPLERRATCMRWGLVPFWAKDPSVGNRMINARSETAAGKPAFRAAMKSRRCVVPADGFYEWKAIGDVKQPFYVHRAGAPPTGAPIAMAGLWERWREKDAPGDEPALETFTILTTSANATLADLHLRMPVILDGAGIERWLDPSVEDAGQLEDLLRPLPDDALDLHPVDRAINRVGNDDPALVEPIEIVDLPGTTREAGADEDDPPTLFG